VPPQGGRCDVAEVRLLRDGSIEDSVRLGEPQDADPTQSASVQLDSSGWSDPIDENGFLYRTTGDPATRTSKNASGWLLFHLWFFYPDSHYAVEIRYRATEAGTTVRVSRGEKLQTATTLPPTQEWRPEVVTLSRAEVADEPPPAERVRGPRVSRWPGEGSLQIESVELADADGEAQAVFEAGAPMRVTMTVVARRAGTYEVIPAAVIYRLDGILVTNLIGERFNVDVDEESRVELALDLGALNLGDGRYVFSLAIYRKLEHLDVSEAYDLLDRSYEFEVTGNAPFDNGVFRHPAAWTLSRADSLMGTVAAAPAQRRI
jgi:Wzt C-terminal domain